MILLVDLYEWPYSEESSLSGAYIDELFAILDPEIGGIRDEDRKVAQLPYREGGRKPGIYSVNYVRRHGRKQVVIRISRGLEHC